MRAILVIIFLLAATPVLAQTRGPAERQLLVDLAQTLGEAHALRQICRGEQDQFWRQRMAQMLEAEKAEAVLERRLVDTFNAGHAQRRRQFPTCTDAARRAEEEVAQRGAQIAQRLSAAGG